ncbi:hypothetical protein RJD24_08160 [Bacillaceae bacterium IKA-2]|nr:hypothetical protein RJD24_08160 [Bacillaceae bacterium IKA-2]
MKSKLGVICIILFLFLTGCVNKEFSEILQDERIDILVHQEEVDNGVVIFYVPNIKGEKQKVNFEARFIQKKLFGWEETYDRGGTIGTLKDNLYSMYLKKYSKKSPFPMLFGEFTNPEIETIKIEYENDTKVIEAKIVENNGKHFWFAFIEEDKIKFTIKGYSINGELLEKVE